ncbi:MAG: hypothetical protein DRJ05_16085, partial [Bacteroidetes bacterium]
GFGNGTAIPVSPGIDVTLNFDVNTNGLENGLHILFIRAKDENDNWSTIVHRPFILGNYPSDPLLPIVRAEYFIDEDPGQGQATPVMFDPNNGIHEQEFDANLDGYEFGEHMLYVRTMDESGHWSITVAEPFNVEEPPIIAEFSADITQGSVPLIVQFTDETLISEPTSWLWEFGDGLTSTFQNPQHTYADPGTYTVSLTATNDQGTNTEVKESYITVYPPIYSLEYFFDEDPGYGNASGVYAYSSNLGGFNFLAPVDDLDEGYHLLFVRVKDTSSVWTQTMTRSFLKTRLMSDPDPSIVQVEYFMDEDPGYGLGEQLAVNNVATPVVDVLISLDEYNDGLHNIYVRSKDANGKWSETSIRPFLKTCLLSDPDPSIVQVEYFVDEDPGYGLGEQLAVNNVATPVVDAFISLDEYDDGLHNIYVRSKDVNGKWSETMARPFLKSYVPNDVVNVASLEYFIDTDPGVGNGTRVSISIPSATVERSFVVNLGPQTPGEHRLFVRAVDERGHWSIVYNQVFEMEPSTACIPPNTLTASDITTNSATLGWTPGETETEWEVLWGLNGFDPETSGNLITDVFSNSFALEDLSPATAYDFYIRAVCGENDLSYWAGSASFTTQEEQTITVPTVLSAEVEQITQTTAIAGGNVTDDGGALVTARGVVWSTTENPSIESYEGITYDGTGIGSWVSELTELTSATNYFVRAYATNSVGTAYGEQVSFITLPFGSPDWQPIPFLQYNMQVIGQLEYEDGTISLNANDLVGAFVGEECRGVMSPDPGFMGILFLTVGSNIQTGETVTFKAWLNDENRIVELNQSLLFENQLQTGSIASPFIFNYHNIGPPSWIPNPYFQYNMQIIGQLEYEDETISLNGEDLVGAFVDEECRGVMSPDPGFIGILFLTVGSNQQSGETITFKAWLNDENRIVELNQSLLFENQLQTGSIANPFIFSYAEAELQTIVVPAGWSGISSYVIPDDPAVEDIFDPVVDEMVILQNFDGMYWPFAGVNTIGNWNDMDGYQIKMETAQQVTFSGEMQSDLTIGLSAGWNYLPVLNPCDNITVDLFSQIVDNLQIVKEVAGWNVYWP